MQSGCPVAYASYALSPTESESYVQLEKECLAVVFGCEHFDQYVYGKALIVESDHKPLEVIFKKSIHKAPARLQKMLLRLQRYNFTLIYKRGVSLTLADTLSRAPTLEEYSTKTQYQVFAVEVVETKQEPQNIKCYSYLVILLSFHGQSINRKCYQTEIHCPSMDSL